MLSLLLLNSALASSLPLASSTYDVQVTGAVADIELEQVFQNESTDWMEAVYSFPLDGGAAVDDMSIVIGDREIYGQIKERQAARETYEAAKRKGQAAGLTEQQRPNLFTQHVANIPPGEDITVRLHVVQPIDRVEEGYEMVIPLVMGPRFSPAGQVADEARITPPVAKDDTGVSVDIDVELVVGMPLSEVWSPTHDAAIDHQVDQARIAIEDAAPDKDFVLRWDVDVDIPQPLALIQDEHMLIRFEPPRSVQRDAVVSRELIWIVDTSGSQMGLPLDMAKDAIHAALDGMDDRDRFAMVQFSDDMSVFTDAPVSATLDNIGAARAWVDDLVAGGGTNMISGVYGGLDMPDDPARERYVIFLTDGLIGNEQGVLATLEDQVGPARVFCFGLGDGTNRWLLEEMARAGGGRASFVTTGEAPSDAVDAFMDTIGQPVLTDIEVDWGDWDVDVVHPQRMGDLMSGQPLEIVARVLRGEGPIEVRGRLAGAAFYEEIPVVSVEGSSVGSLWARAHVADLARQQRWGEVPEIKEEILQTALEYNLLTQYTSFVAVQRRVINRSGRSQRAEHPQMLPEGMEYETSVSRRYTPPGDPLLVVDAPADARSVLAVYPWGDTVKMQWDGLRERWYDRFLVPRDVPDGQIEIVIFVQGADGHIDRRVEIMFVDSEAEEFTAWLTQEAGATVIHLLAEEPLRTLQVQPVGHPELRKRVNVVVSDAFEHRIVMPGFWDEVELLVTDRAMNTRLQEVSR